MSNPSDLVVLRRVSALIQQLRAAVNEPSRLQAVVQQKSFVETAQSVLTAVAEPPGANDHLTEEQVTDAVGVCDDIVIAFIVGEDPRSVDWMSLDACNTRARSVIGETRVHEIYRTYRPEQLPDYVDAEAANGPASR